MKSIHRIVSCAATLLVVLTLVNAFPTQGTGSGADFGSQGAEMVTPKHKLVYAVNAGSNEISASAIRPTGLTFRTYGLTGF